MRRALFYTVAIPIGIVVVLFEWLKTLPAAWLATMHVFDIVLERYEYWSFRVDHDAFVNNPYRKTLWRYWKDTFFNAGCVTDQE